MELSVKKIRRKNGGRKEVTGKKKIAAAVIGLLGVSIAAAAGVMLWKKNSGTEEALKENQFYVYAYVSEIEGNELTYMKLDEAVVEAYIARTQETDEAKAEGGTAGDGEAQGENQKGGMPDGERPDAGMPEREENPEGNSSEEEIPEHSSAEGVTEGEAPGMELVTTLIPVSTTVHTSTDTETTFQRLAAGDMLKLLIEPDEDEEEVIVEIWML
ncbi:MAG: hypothetical protein J6K53_03250 [Roseburia sp.]|nr:hypothetical protein [Roseburia sp.]